MLKRTLTAGTGFALKSREGLPALIMDTPPQKWKTFLKSYPQTVGYKQIKDAVKSAFKGSKL